MTITYSAENCVCKTAPVILKSFFFYFNDKYFRQIILPFPSPHSSCATPAHSARPRPRLYRSSTAGPGTWHPGPAASSQSRPKAEPTAGTAGRDLP